MGPSPISVPKILTFYHTVLGAAIDSNCRRKKKMLKKRQKQNGAYAAPLFGPQIKMPFSGSQMTS